MAVDDAGFGTELRGYKKDEVDQALGELRRDLIKANQAKTDLSKDVKRLQAVTDDLQAELDEWADRPTPVSAHASRAPFASPRSRPPG